jgi:hypothetical protein
LSAARTPGQYYNSSNSSRDDEAGKATDTSGQLGTSHNVAVQSWQPAAACITLQLQLADQEASSKPAR